MQAIERLCARAPETPHLPPRKAYALPQDVVVLYEYAGAQVFHSPNKYAYLHSHAQRDASMCRLVLRALLGNDGTREVSFEWVAG